MIRRLILFNLLFTCFYSHAQLSDSAIFFHEEIKAFFSSIQPLRGNLYISDKPKGIISKETFKIFFPNDTLFTKADLDFIDKQVILNKISAWDSSFIDKRILIKDSETKSKERYITYSIPSFSLDLQTCVLFVDVNCNLALCGEGYILILRKRNGVWEVVDGDMTWVS